MNRRHYCEGPGCGYCEALIARAELDRDDREAEVDERERE